MIKFMIYFRITLIKTILNRSTLNPLVLSVIFICKSYGMLLSYQISQSAKLGLEKGFRYCKKLNLISDNQSKGMKRE